MPRKKIYDDRTKYKNQYAAEKYDRISLIVAKGRKDKIKAHAEAQGKSINDYINNLIARDMGPGD
jgi:uncharacterized protein (DUF1778 family)